MNKESNENVYIFKQRIDNNLYGQSLALNTASRETSVVCLSKYSFSVYFYLFH